MKRSYDDVEQRMSRDGDDRCGGQSTAGRRLAVEVQFPTYEAEEKAYLEMTSQDSYEDMAQVQQRLVELLHDQKNCLAYRKRTEMAVELVQQIEAEGQFPMSPMPLDISKKQIMRHASTRRHK